MKLPVMLDLVEKALPCGSNHWDDIEDRFNHHVGADRARERGLIRSKFQRLAKHPVLTGDPSCPPHVARAKQLAQEIDTDVSVQTLDDGGRDENLADENVPPADADDEDGGDGINAEVATPEVTVGPSVSSEVVERADAASNSTIPGMFFISTVH
jgi:hypothetical protein